MEEYPEPQAYTQKKIGLLGWVLIFLVDAVLLLILIGYFLTLAPGDFSPQEINIDKGESARAIAEQLAEMNIVKSGDVLYAVLVTQFDPSSIKAGTFNFTEPLSVFAVAEKITTEIPQEDQLTITFPEGFYARNFTDFIPTEISENNEVAINVPSVEGYLFPDTYRVPVTYGEQEVLQLLLDTFNEKLVTLEAEITASPYTLEEVIILASIIEREANDPESMGMVAGVIENRLAIGMALQVDASVAYGLEKSGTELTRADIETDGPYNTYTRAGLPPTPISNPGLQAINAVLNSTPSEYFFYITGNDGNFYYAKTLPQHNININRYLH